MYVMGISQKAVLALLVGCFMSAGAQAAVSYGNGQPYVGAKIGQFMVDEGELDDPTAFGAYVGSSEESINISGVNVDYDLKTYGIYGAYRYVFPNTALYAKGKLGFAKAEIDVKASGFGSSVSDSDSDTGVAGGIGLGYLVNPNIAIEGEYALVAEDLDLLTIGVNLKF
jgi:opacity protein-like surface antigen